MNFFWVLLLAAVLLETIFVSYPFTLMVVIMSILSNGAESLLFAFLAGLILDFIGLKPLGINSIIFLILSAFIMRYNRRINFSSFWNVTVFIFISIYIYTYVFYKLRMNFVNILLTIVLTVAFLYVLPYLIPMEKTGKKYKV